MSKVLKDIVGQIKRDGLKKITKTIYLGAFMFLTYLLGEAEIARESMLHAKDFDWGSPLVRLDLVALLTALSIIFIYVWFTVIHFKTKIIAEYSHSKMFAFTQATVFALSAGAFLCSNHFSFRIIPQELSDLLYDIKDVLTFAIIMVFLLDAFWFSKVLMKDNA
ncbi:hypothetical protein [Bathymodiolus septemdierum thioautotrophic gill symbiont]|uniref:Uncharacterized protein n=1 Tax=endosymbiont of Bathymodiolus septemdierum str. Myojin knoll TaxID=1303921 RepID=A0A0P0URP8_9GAMM|nr:hypothetical protein [Bathymodiolus septemdierum thioautotrophic gill symbiont]BAS67634.1 hypothetical protein BSEPE_0631 [endosymbiont of Bathymodiolus septemdierum str. Myojin knoll]